MEGTNRREAIMQQLQQAEKPISASKFAEGFGVSRQIIVGDIALLRAAGEEIIATARGYKLAQEMNQAGIISKIAVQHGPEQTEEELLTFVSLGAEVLDVLVEHEIYGELTGSLHILNEQDVASFMKRYRKANVQLLSALTEGIHLHTIRYEQPETLTKIKEALREKGILYEA